MDSNTPDEMEFIDELPETLGKIQRQFDAYQKACFMERPAEFFALELNGEAGELANDEKKLWKGKTIASSKLEDEAADVFIALMNYCNARGLNIGAAVARKVAVIEKRRQDGTF